MAAVDPNLDQKLDEERPPERLIELRDALDDLVREGVVAQRDAEDLLIQPRTKKQLSMHPIEIIAEREMDDQLRQGKKVDLDWLTQWLCDRSGQPY